MAYSQPHFNLFCDIWDCSYPADGAPDWDAVPCQKYIRSRLSLDTLPQDEAGWWKQFTPPIQLRFPRTHPAFIDPPSFWAHLSFECPAGSGQFYRARWNEIMHQGFPNEYAIILVTPCSDTGLSIPPPSEDTPVGSVDDVCFVPPAPPVEKVNAEFIGDSGSDDHFGLIARYLDDQNFYLVRYLGGGPIFALSKVIAGVETILDDAPITDPLSPGDTCDMTFTLDGDSLSVRIITPLQDVTLTATDSDLPTIGTYGVWLSNSTAAVANNWTVYYDLVVVLQDLFSDTIGTNLTAHTMNTGSGWAYVETPDEIVIDASGNAAQAIVGGILYGPAAAVSTVP